MQRDLIEAYKRVYSSCWTQKQAYERMVDEPAPRYYVSPKQASVILSPMMKGDFVRVDMMMPLRREMYYSLYHEVIKLCERREFIGKSLSYIMKFAVTQPAPKFYISPTRAKIIRSYIRNGVFDENGRVRDEKLPSYIICREKKRVQYQARKKWMLERMSEGKESLQ
jgi:hypothetical protein